MPTWIAVWIVGALIASPFVYATLAINKCEDDDDGMV